MPTLALHILTLMETLCTPTSALRASPLLWDLDEPLNLSEFSVLICQKQIIIAVLQNCSEGCRKIAYHTMRLPQPLGLGDIVPSLLHT